MTSEEDFQRMLDANPDDWQTRLIFADWLEDRGDGRAEGYRALGRNRYFPHPGVKEQEGKCPYYTNRALLGIDTHYALPKDWFEKIKMRGKTSFDAPRWGAFRATRQICDDAAALAFAKLPAPRQAELLSPEVVTRPAGEG